MKLTPAQQQLVLACASAETRTQNQMLSLLLLEGVNYYFLERPTQAEAIGLRAKDLEEELVQSLGLGSLTPEPDNVDWEN
jgi:hypothetical protein